MHPNIQAQHPFQKKGLLSAMQGEPQAPRQAPEGELQETEASPEEQAQYDALMQEAIQKLYGGKAFDSAVAMFQQGGPEGFPHIMAFIVVGMLDTMEKTAGGQLDDDMLAAMGAELIGVISEDLEEAGVLQVDDKMLQESAAVALASWMQKHPDRVDPEAVQEAAAMGGQIPQGQPPQARPQQQPMGGY